MRAGGAPRPPGPFVTAAVPSTASLGASSTRPGAPLGRAPGGACRLGAPFGRAPGERRCWPPRSGAPLWRAPSDARLGAPVGRAPGGRATPRPGAPSGRAPGVASK
eukprot:6486468-Lingulodinium_polyedra.AAC.1